MINATKSLVLISIVCISPIKAMAGSEAIGSGRASYYSSGSKTANGEHFNPDGHTAAHRTLPFGTHLRVTNTANGHSVVVRVNDRGPFIKGRVLDLSRGAAKAIGMIDAGTAHIQITRVN